MSQLNEATDRALEEAFFELDDAEQKFEVLLVGGSTRLLLVREWVREKFNKTPDTSVPPEEVIALGAALFAGENDNQSPTALR